MLFGIPMWFFVCIAVTSLFLGVLIRHYIDRRKAKEEERHKEQVKAMKKQLKYEKKHAKKK